VVDVRLLSNGAVEHFPVEQLEVLLNRDDGIVWVDIPQCDEQAVATLTRVFGFHALAVHDCVERNAVPKVQVYADHALVVLHTPERGEAGHVHYVELDQIVGPRYLVTVHGPLNPAVDPSVAMRETQAVLRRLESGRLRPGSSYALSYAIITAVANRLRDYLATLTSEVWQLEQRVTAADVSDAEQFLEVMFRARHGLLAVRTMAALSREVFGRMAMVRAFGERGQSVVEDAVDQFTRIGTMADGEREYLQGVIEYQQSRTNTKIAIAAERLAVIAAVTLPITALSSVLGMNVIVNSATDPVLLVVLIAVMTAMSVTLLIWAKRKGWW
jgi:magnesium transporter